MNLQQTITSAVRVLSGGDDTASGDKATRKLVAMKRRHSEYEAERRGLSDQIMALNGPKETAEVNLQVARRNKNEAAIKIAELELSSLKEDISRLRHRMGAKADVCNALRQTVTACEAGLRRCGKPEYNRGTVEPGVKENENAFDVLDMVRGVFVALRAERWQVNAAPMTAAEAIAEAHKHIDSIATAPNCARCWRGMAALNGRLLCNWLIRLFPSKNSCR